MGHDHQEMILMSTFNRWF